MVDEDRLRARAERLHKAVKDRYAALAQDPALFQKLFPGETLSLSPGHCSPADQMRAIASNVMEKSGFEWTVAEVLCGDPIFMIGQYDPRDEYGPGGAI